MRTFIALVPPSHVTARLEEIGKEITRIERSLRCEHAEKLHFTLEFLGEKTGVWVEKCRAALQPAIASRPPFPVTIRSIGFFPGRANARIIWAGSRPDENAALCALASDLRRLCTALGHVPDPKPFHPHITLARVKSHLAPAAAERIAALAMEPMEFECRAIAMIKSTLSSGGSRYETLFALPAGEAPADRHVA